MIDGVVIAEKTLHKGMCMGHISNCGGTIDLGNGKSIKFIGLNDKFLTLQLIENGIGKEVKTSTWQKSKKVVEKKVVEKIVKVPVKKKEEQIKFNISDDKEEIF